MFFGFEMERIREELSSVRECLESLAMMVHFASERRST
jgi:hypothetical protein